MYLANEKAVEKPNPVAKITLVKEDTRSEDQVAAAAREEGQDENGKF